LLKSGSLDLELHT